jgi:ribosomal protein S3AE
MIITKSKTKRSVLTAIMMKTREHLSEVLKELKYAEFINDVISTKAQKTLREQLKKIYPVAVLEFRVVERV